MSPAQHLLCTVGTSLFSNLKKLKPGENDALATAWQGERWPDVAAELAKLPDEERLCGAEVNSIASLKAHGHVAPDCGLFFFHSDTDDGRLIADILRQRFQTSGHAPVETVEVTDLQDQDPKRFRTKGLRNLARFLCRVLRERSPAACALNATGGYKAQIAIAVLLGQAIGVPVFYKHELFSEIIAFPPMPVALDFEVWMRASGLLRALEASVAPCPAARFAAEWDEKYESLVDHVDVDGQDCLDLSPTGQIFHETFRERFRTAKDQMLPPRATQKRPPRLEQAGWPGKHPEVERLLTRLTHDVPQVVQCGTEFFSPDLPERTRFGLSRGGVIGVYSDGRFTVKFRVETTAQTEGQRAAVVAALNEWLAAQP